MQQDLVNMMSQHLQLNPIQHNHDLSMPPTPQVSPQPQPIAYITQHYHHSSHQAGSSPETQVSSLLESVGINAAALLPSQLQLFKNADDQQKQRLIELWSISPPTPGKQMLPSQSGNWPQTSMEHEEAAARHRWEESETERLKSSGASTGNDPAHVAEPCMAKGYESIPNIDITSAPTSSRSPLIQENPQHLKDPVYNSQSREWWNVEDDGPMEHQYGMLQQIMYGNYVEYGQPTKRDEDEDMS